MLNINDLYMQEKVAVKDHLLQESNILLNHFLTPAAVRFIVHELSNCSFDKSVFSDTHVYEEAEVSDRLLEIMGTVKDFFVEVLGEEKELVDVRLLRFSQGCYALQHDDQPSPGIDVALFLMGSDWDKSFRGELTYVPEEGDPLTVFPDENSLSAVVRSARTNTFFKRVSHHAGISSFVVVRAVLI